VNCGIKSLDFTVLSQALRNLTIDRQNASVGSLSEASADSPLLL
jgi:hypothetical protein